MRESADLVLTNGKIYTVDSQRPRAQAVAIQGESIVAVGENAEIQSWVGQSTRVVDLKGQFAMPGFNDAHIHIAAAGFAKLAVNLNGAKSLEEFQQRIRDRRKDFRPGEWIKGDGWDHTRWPERRFPTRQDLDTISHDHPMMFVRVDGHVAVTNSLGLEIAGITRETPDPPGGKIVRDPTTGEPTGILEDYAAMNLVFRRIPPRSRSQRRRAIELALEELKQNGVTSAQDISVLEVSADDISSWENFLVYEELRREGKLPVRITEWLPFELSLKRLEEKRHEREPSDAWLKTGALKAFLDGSLGARTAAMLAPYSDDPTTSGIVRMDPKELERMAIERDRTGFQLAFHAIGDLANRLALAVFSAVRAANGPRDRRDRVEHAQVVATGDFARFASLGIIASMQPCHLLEDELWAEARLGPDRSRGAYAWKTMEKSGVHLAFGTDYPYGTDSPNPLRGIYACVTRELPDGGPSGGWELQEKLPIENCIRDYTVSSAYAEFEETRKGILAPGMLADIVVLPEDITRISPRELLRMQVSMTIAGGRVVYERK